MATRLPRKAKKTTPRATGQRRPSAARTLSQPYGKGWRTIERGPMRPDADPEIAQVDPDSQAEWFIIGPTKSARRARKPAGRSSKKGRR